MTQLPLTNRRTAMMAALLLPCVARAQAPERPRLDVPFVPTPMPVVDKMLQMARLQRGDTLYDLGCGDGRIVIEAAKRHGARGVGIDLDPQRIAEAQANARRERVTERVSFRREDLFETDLSPADVVTLYLLPAVNLRLRPQLLQQLRVGSRVVSHSFDMGPSWPPERTERVQNALVYAWTVTEQAKARA